MKKKKKIATSLCCEYIPFYCIICIVKLVSVTSKKKSKTSNHRRVVCVHVFVLVHFSTDDSSLIKHVYLCNSGSHLVVICFGNINNHFVSDFMEAGAKKWVVWLGFEVREYDGQPWALIVLEYTQLLVIYWIKRTLAVNDSYNLVRQNVLHDYAVFWYLLLW